MQSIQLNTEFVQFKIQIVNDSWTPRNVLGPFLPPPPSLLAVGMYLSISPYEDPNSRNSYVTTWHLESGRNQHFKECCSQREYIYMYIFSLAAADPGIY